MSSYHYNGSQRWTARERQQFRRAWRVHRKQFHLLKSAVSQSERGSETERLLENQRNSLRSLLCYRSALPSLLDLLCDIAFNEYCQPLLPLAPLVSGPPGLHPPWSPPPLVSTPPGLCPPWSLPTLVSAPPGLCPPWSPAPLVSTPPGLHSPWSPAPLVLGPQVEGKTLSEVTEYYYYWKKYCNDEYRGRNRHVSEEVSTTDKRRSTS